MPSNNYLLAGLVLAAITLFACSEPDFEIIEGYPTPSGVTGEYGVFTGVPVEVSAVATMTAKHEASPKEWIAPWLRPNADQVLIDSCPENSFSRRWVKKDRIDTGDMIRRNPHGLIRCAYDGGLIDGMPGFRMKYVTPIPTGEYKPPPSQYDTRIKLIPTPTP